jgi:hypothetical protein
MINMMAMRTSKVLALAVIALATACRADSHVANGSSLERPIEASTEETRDMKITIKSAHTTVMATLNNSKSARDFFSLLPLDVTMKDLFNREKFAPLPRAISEDAARTRTYEVGDVAYWSPSHDIAIFYRDDGQAIPSPGLIMLGKIESVAVIDVPGPVRVTIERAR